MRWCISLSKQIVFKKVAEVERLGRCHSSASEKICGTGLRASCIDCIPGGSDQSETQWTTLDPGVLRAASHTCKLESSERCIESILASLNTLEDDPTIGKPISSFHC